MGVDHLRIDGFYAGSFVVDEVDAVVKSVLFGFVGRRPGLAGVGLRIGVQFAVGVGESGLIHQQAGGPRNHVSFVFVARGFDPVEVGVDVPNASVMMVENAERFGLAELHQLRGRVGRGKEQSYCIMINTSDSEKAAERLGILNASNDGFKIAEEDLKLRGPGDIFGFKQSGEASYRIADIYRDTDILKKARRAVDMLLKTDPELEEPEDLKLNKMLLKYMETGNIL